jgi:copper resistance protein C
MKTLRSMLGGAALALLLEASPVLAHAIVVSSQPQAHENVKGPDLAVEIRFNTRIDTSRSRLTLKRPDGSSVDLSLQGDAERNVLRSAVDGLVPGVYGLSWQTLSIDGHITHGAIPFEVSR